MSSIHDSEYCAALRSRVDQLTPQSQRLWGEMTVDQMLWHVNGGLSLGLGKLRAAKRKPGIPLPLLIPMALYLPIPKSKAPTIPEMKAEGQYDFNAERARFHSLVEEFSLRPLHINWLEHPVFGRLSGPHWSRIQANHVHHHLKQFGV